jgi:ribA/ribD-fused uncharacterized protein
MEGNGNEPLFFYGESHCLSQWYRCTFSVQRSDLYYLAEEQLLSRYVPKVVWFNCAEQYMMYCKAVCFGDFKAALEILAAKSPAEQKECGRRVDGFDLQIWKSMRETVVEKGNLAKFSQVPECRSVLLCSGSRLLGEASRDKIWAVGLAQSALNKQKETDGYYSLCGENLLGKALMRVREKLRESVEQSIEADLVADEREAELQRELDVLCEG